MSAVAACSNSKALMNHASMDDILSEMSCMLAEQKHLDAWIENDGVQVSMFLESRLEILFKLLNNVSSWL